MLVERGDNPKKKLGLLCVEGKKFVSKDYRLPRDEKKSRLAIRGSPTKL